MGLRIILIFRYKCFHAFGYCMPSVTVFNCILIISEDLCAENDTARLCLSLKNTSGKSSSVRFKNFYFLIIFLDLAEPLEYIIPLRKLTNKGTPLGLDTSKGYDYMMLNHGR